MQAVVAPSLAASPSGSATRAARRHVAARAGARVPAGNTAAGAPTRRPCRSGSRLERVALRPGRRFASAPVSPRVGTNALGGSFDDADPEVWEGREDPWQAQTGTAA